MTTKRFLTLAVAILCLSAAQAAPRFERISSPDGSLTLRTGLDHNGQAVYRLTRGNETIVADSRLGFVLDDGMFATGMVLKKAERTAHDDTWTQPWGEQAEIRNHYNQLTLQLQEKTGQHRKLNIVFRLFDDGLGLRYEFPEQPHLKRFVIMDELTEFVFPGDAIAWSQPTRGVSYYESVYSPAPISAKDTIATPVTLEVNDSLFVVLHEANLTDYASLTLASRPAPAGSGGTVSLLAALVPWQNGDKVRAEAPRVTPWRTVIVRRSAADLITSRLVLNLNEPCALDDTSWLETGKYIGIWWGMHMDDYTWAQGPKHGANTENTRRYIDFAAKHGFKGVLVEGWNVGWDGDWTKEGDKFDFTKPYPDYDLEGLCRYARERGVRIIAHNETGGAAQNYEQQLEQAFALYQQLGINCIKTGYVNDLMDFREHQHSQYGVRHYRKVVETAAKYHLMVDNHEPAMPTGLRRTWPNLVSGEGARGQEYNAWSTDGGNPPAHVCTLPFTRLLAGPLDFTPGIVNFHNPAHPGTHPQTTLAKQLAEYVVLYSPWQMAADKIENYEHHPALSWIESVPTDWATTIVPMARIGQYVTIARRDRNSDNWYVGTVTDQTPRTMQLSLDFLDADATYVATIYEDGPGADYRTNPYPLTIRTLTVTSVDEINLNLAPSGGAAIRLIKQ